MQLLELYMKTKIKRVFKKSPQIFQWVQDLYQYASWEFDALIVG
jgi:hypothetical protein